MNPSRERLSDSSGTLTLPGTAFSVPLGTFITFDDPAAGTCSASCGAIGDGQGTRGYAINLSGEVAGFFTDNSARLPRLRSFANGTSPRSMLRTPAQVRFRKGPLSQKLLRWVSTRQAQSSAFMWTQIQSNTASCALVAAKSLSSIPPGSIFTTPNAIDSSGNITGFYFDANSVGHGFLRAPDGNFTVFDAPGADHTPGSFNGTFGVGLTPTGEVEGVYVDINGVLHGFIRSPQGNYTTYDVPGAGTGPGQGTLPESNDDFGDDRGKLLRRQRRESWLPS